MRKYNKPEVEITLLSDVDVICTSAVVETPEAPGTRKLKTKVAGNEGECNTLSLKSCHCFIESSLCNLELISFSLYNVGLDKMFNLAVSVNGNKVTE